MFHNQVKNQNMKNKDSKQTKKTPNKTQQFHKVGCIVTDDQMKILPQTPPVGKQGWFGCSCAPNRDTDEE